MTRKIRTLIAEDSATFRKLIERALCGQDDIEIVGTAKNGNECLALLEQLRPDVVTLDIEMPDLDGLGVLKAWPRGCPNTQVLVLSSLSERGASTTLAALALGASDYLAKPQGAGPEESFGSLRDELLKKIRALGNSKTKSHDIPKPSRASRPPLSEGVPARSDPKARDVMPDHPNDAEPSPTARKLPEARPQAFIGVPGKIMPARCVAIGASTGGPPALEELLGGLPAQFHVPLFVVQHMPAAFLRVLSERLHSLPGPPVKIAEPDELVRPGVVYLPSGDGHLVVKRDAEGFRLVVNNGPLINGVRPAIDPLFTSVAKAYGAACLGVVLTGMGEDGRDGALSIRQAGGSVIAQDEDTSTVWGMPQAVINAGLANAVVPIGQMAQRICYFTRYAQGLQQRGSDWIVSGLRSQKGKT